MGDEEKTGVVVVPDSWMRVVKIWWMPVLSLALHSRRGMLAPGWSRSTQSPSRAAR